MSLVAESYRRLTEDRIRGEHPFSTALSSATEAILRADGDDSRADILGQWLASSQPCLFGKLAAKKRMIEYCFLSEADLLGSERDLRGKIQSARRRWWAEGLAARKSNFVILAYSERLFRARPDTNLFGFAQSLAQLYLLEEEIEADRIYLDSIYLEAPGQPRTHLFRWRAGVNVFAAAGDGRWWQDHRIPGGLGFSINSVGHMVMSSELSSALSEYYRAMNVEFRGPAAGAVDTLDKALVMAMSTIANASESVSGKATWLIRAEEAGEDGCGALNVELGKKLEGHTHCHYEGTYHTDFTLPSLYFREEVERPSEATAVHLDFTYLHVDSSGNPAFQTMGEGERIRAEDATADELSYHDSASAQKSAKNWGMRIPLSDIPDEVRRLLGS